MNQEYMFSYPSACIYGSFDIYMLMDSNSLLSTMVTAQLSSPPFTRKRTSREMDRVAYQTKHETPIHRSSNKGSLQRDPELRTVPIAL